jgi:uncharacterized protein
MIRRDQAFKIVEDHIENKNLIKHCLAVEAAMKGLAKHFREDENRWGLLGLVHDADWEVTQNDVKNHSKVTGQWLKEAGLVDEEIYQALYAHNYFYDGEQLPQTKIGWSLYCCDDLTGLIVASTLVLPDKKLASLTVQSVMKKFPTKRFAAGVNREQIKLCEEKLGIKLEDFVSIILKSMQEISNELGL